MWWRRTLTVQRSQKADTSVETVLITLARFCAAGDRIKPVNQFREATLADSVACSFADVPPVGVRKRSSLGVVIGQSTFTPAIRKRPAKRYHRQHRVSLEHPCTRYRNKRVRWAAELGEKLPHGCILAEHLRPRSIRWLHPAVTKAHRRPDKVLDRPLTVGIFHDGRLVEQDNRRRRVVLGLPIKNRALSLAVVHNARRAEFLELPVVSAEHPDEGTRVCGGPRGIKSNQQCRY